MTYGFVILIPSAGAEVSGTNGMQMQSAVYGLTPKNECVWKNKCAKSVPHMTQKTTVLFVLDNFLLCKCMFSK